MGKVTGVVPSLIHVDGTRTAIRRIAPTSIREQVWVLRRAAREGAQALVIECMAIKPELQWVSEHRMIRSQIGVITNVRADHTDLLGESGEALARSLVCTIPYNGILFTAEKEHCGFLAEEAETRGTKLVCISANEQIEPALEEKIPRWIHHENLALALAVCQQIGVPRKEALCGMLTTVGDVGSFRIIRFSMEEKDFLFVNAFAGNDPVSTKILLGKALSTLPGTPGPVIGLFNHRRDRLFRAQTLAGFAQEAAFDRLFLIGERLRGFHRFFPEAVDLSAIDSASALCERIGQEIEDGSLVFGFGNIAGSGLALSEHLQQIGREI